VSTSEPVVFAETLDGMRRALGAKLTPALLAEVKALGIDFDKLQVAYSLPTWLAVMKRIADVVAADAPEHERFRILGRQFMRGFTEQGLGRAALAAGKIFGVRRTLMRMGRNFQTATNYIAATATDVGQFEVHIRTYVLEPFLSAVDRTGVVLDYRRGVLEEILALLGVNGFVDIIDARAERGEATFRVTWT
jgi:uncharacterized protein (TIGR02265 family)